MNLSLQEKSPVVSVASVSGRRKQRGWRRYRSRTFYFFAAPWLLGFVLLTLIPMVYALLLSFTNFDGLSGDWRWIGLSNYSQIFHDSTAIYSLLQSFLYALITVPLGLAGGLGLALLLNQRVRAVGVFRTIFYVPSIIPIAATALMFKFLFDRDTGLVNTLLGDVHLPTVSWLLDPTAFLVLIILALWGLGGGMVIFLAGLQGIPQELLEAASIDGANAWQRFRAITLPALSPVMLFQLVVSIIYALQTLVQPLLLSPFVSTGAGQGFTDPSNVQHGDYLYMVHVYAQFFTFQNYGYGAALLWVLFAIVLVFTLLILRTSAFWVYYEVDQTQGREV
jgi:multiple sugar transport system permease protein